MEDFLIIILIHIIISVMCFIKNYKSIEKDYLVKHALIDCLLCLIPFVNIVYLLDDIIERIRYKLYIILNKKIK